MPLPTVIVTEPPVPAVAAPVPSEKLPLVPELAVPELKTKAPLTPTNPAFADRTKIAPLVVAMPAPVVIEIKPPV